MQQPKRIPLSVCLASLGTGLEMYDFIIFVFFSSYIAATYFPLESRFASILLTFTIFAVGYFCRTIGAILFGHYADRHGRKRSLLFTIFTMAAPAILITFMPSYHTAGLVAPVVIALSRALQGLAVGGEFSGAVTLTYELVPANKSAFYSSWIILALNVGILVATIIAAIVQTVFITNYHLSWGWRIAFFIGIILIIIAAIIRRYATESEEFHQLTKKASLPIRDLFQENGLTLLRLIFIMAGPATAVGIIVFFPIYMRKFSHLTSDTVDLYNIYFLISLCICIVIAGLFSDRFGKKNILGFGFLLTAILSVPAGWGLTSTTHSAIFISAILLGAVIGIMLANFGGVLAESLPIQYRGTGVGIAYNVPFSIITGTFPALSLYIEHTSGHLEFQYSYIIILCLFALSHLFFLKKLNTRASLMHGQST